MTKKRRIFRPKDLDAFGNVETRSFEIPTTHKYDLKVRHPSHGVVAKVRRKLLSHEGFQDGGAFVEFLINNFLIHNVVIEQEDGTEEVVKVTFEEMETILFGGEDRPIPPVIEKLTEIAKTVFSLPGEDYEGAHEDEEISPN